MKEPDIGIGTCGCWHCRMGQIRYDKRLRNRKRRQHQRLEIRYYLDWGISDDYLFRMPCYSQHTD